MSIVIDELGYPIESGASDGEDSCRLNSMLVLIGHEKAIDPGKYIDLNHEYKYLIRHPKAKLPFSRDQQVPEVMALDKCSRKDICEIVYNDLKKNFYRTPNGDFCSPSVINHHRLAAGLQGFWLGFKWLELDIKYNAWRLQRWADKKEKWPAEQNQLISLLEVAQKYSDINWYKRYLESSPHIKVAIEHYWDQWRLSKEDGVSEGIFDHIVYSSKVECICGEINSRNCPVHQ